MSIPPGPHVDADCDDLDALEPDRGRVLVDGRDIRGRQRQWQQRRALPPTPENLSAVIAGRLFIGQKPGPKNSRGLAKFIFPNAENVYMHGTPAQQPAHKSAPAPVDATPMTGVGGLTHQS